MNDLFVFPMECTGLLYRWDKERSIKFIDSNEGKMMIGTPKITDSMGYNPFDCDHLIPDFIKMIEKSLDSVNLEKDIKKWLQEWGPLYSDPSEKNTVEVFQEESFKFYKLWNLYKALSNRNMPKIMEFISLEDYEDHYKITFFPNDTCFTGEPNSFIEEEFDFKCSFPMGKKTGDELFIEIQTKAAVFFFEQIEEYTSQANLYWGSMKTEKDQFNVKIEPVLRIENLIDAIYLQFYILFSENEKKICPVCNTPFVPERKDKKYCSDTCKHTAKSRRYRARKTS